MSEEKLKFLVLNPSPSTLPKAIKIGASLNKKSGPFSSILLLGDIIDSENAEIPKLNTPNVPVYYTEGTHLIDDKENLDSGLKYLGSSGVTKTTAGITIGYLTGNLKDVTQEEVEKSFGTSLVDILITYQWPSAIGKEEKLTLVANDKIDIAVKACKPRYHFAVGADSGRFHERAPFSWDGTNRVTRFISLAEQGSTERWYYAFNMSIELEDTASITNITENPFTKMEVEVTSSLPSSLPSIPGKRAMNDQDSQVTKKKKEVTPQSCFFCLSNPKVLLHLLVSIGNTCYITATRGPLTFKNEAIEFSGHGLITPIDHISSLRNYKEGEEKASDVTETSLYKEIQKYQNNLIRSFQGKSDKLDVVFWEISREKSIHHHIQFLPLLSSLSEKLQEQIDKQIEFNNNKYKKSPPLKYTKLNSSKEEDMKILDEVRNSEDFMLITLAHNLESREFYLFKLGTDGHQIDLQFPRRVVSFLLKAPKRLRWENCIQSISDETSEAEALKSLLELYEI